MRLKVDIVHIDKRQGRQGPLPCHSSTFTLLEEATNGTAKPIDQKPPNGIHESSSVGARPSSAAPVELYPVKLKTEQRQLTMLQ
jgi:hypothetical protein